MYVRNRGWAWIGLVVVCLAWITVQPAFVSGDQEGSSSFIPRSPVIKPERSTVPPGYDNRHIEVKFLDELDIGLSAVGVPEDRSGAALRTLGAPQALSAMTAAGGVWRRLAGPPETVIDDLVRTAERNLNRDIADLNNYFILAVPEGVSTEDWLDQLNALPDVEIALAMPLPVPAPVPGNYQSQQGYLNNAPGGIGASAAWSIAGGTGNPTTGPQVAVCDLEYSFNNNHNDMPAVDTLLPSGYTFSDPFADNRHGTAVIGEVASLSDALGTTGASYGVRMKFAPTYLDPGSGPAWLIGTAMSNAMASMSAGDVFLIEQQYAGPNYISGTNWGFIPIEWWPSWYNTIVTAVGNGFHVVEAAGNGNENLDAAIYSTGNGGHWPFLPANNSGAIIVGAGAVPGGSDVDRSRILTAFWGSTYGSRLDLQGWGENVTTCAYADLWSETNYNYTSVFSGTSSASPIVASAVAILESVYESANSGAPLTPAQARSILKTTGSPQQAGTRPVSENIGPRPDLTVAIQNLPQAQTDTCEYYKDSFPDYATAGVPDFDQKQGQWISPQGNWSHCGPVALADCFWWFDSKFEPFPVDPRPFSPSAGTPPLNDNYPLLYSFDPTGLWDDHDTNNVVPFVDSLALYCKTNFGGVSGTYVYDLAAGAQAWLTNQGLGSKYTVRVAQCDTFGFEEIRQEVLMSQNVILLLGFWEEIGMDMCERVGGHYVTAAGTCPNPLDSALCISDPYFDKNEGEPPAGSAHGSTVHNDAGLVSGPHGTMHHDRYNIVWNQCPPSGPPFPFFPMEVQNYPVNAGNVIQWQGQNDFDTTFTGIPPGGLPIHTVIEFAVIICPDSTAAPDTLKNHYKGWRINPQPLGLHALVEDQFMTDDLFLIELEYLVNPAHKDTSAIRRPDDHLLWYKADGRDTLLQVEIDNQFGTDTIIIDSVTHLLVPCRKDPHDPPDSLLGHYKAYRIKNADMLVRPVSVQDQFNVQPEILDSLRPAYFLVPAIKNQEPVYGSDTHYVAYEIFPKLDDVHQRFVDDQFGTWDVVTERSELLLVPTHKIAFGPPPVTDTLRNHYKGWRIDPQPVDLAVNVTDQFTTDSLHLWEIEFLANPARKDTSDIRRPNDHLNWYRADGRPISLGVDFVNQFGRDTVFIDDVTHLLVPCRKSPHGPPDALLGHYKAYRIRDAAPMDRVVSIEDQFNMMPEIVDVLTPRYFLTPCTKNAEPIPPRDTHYVVYEIDPKTAVPEQRITEDQFGIHDAIVQESWLLMVPTHKIDFWATCLDSDSDGVCDTLDNCPTFPNPLQENSDADSLGDSCDNCIMVYNPLQEDGDLDAVGDSCDNCPAWINPSQEDGDLDAVGDSCDNCLTVFNPNQADFDADLVGDTCDNCPLWINPLQEDFDSDLVGDSCDNCPFVYNPLQEDSNGNAIGDSCESSCPVVMTGDVNTDGAYTASDIIYLVNFTFKGGPTPMPCQAAGDVTCDGAVTAADIIFMVNHIFKGGPAPCDVCTKIADGTWTCP